MNWHLLPVKKIDELLGSSVHGISSARAEEHLARYGPNILEEKKKKPAWRLFLDQFADFMIVVLMAAAVISGLIGDLTDTIASQEQPFGAVALSGATECAAPTMTQAMPSPRTHRGRRSPNSVSSTMLALPALSAVRRWRRH